MREGTSGRSYMETSICIPVGWRRVGWNLRQTSWCWLGCVQSHLGARNCLDACDIAMSLIQPWAINHGANRCTFCLEVFAFDKNNVTSIERNGPCWFQLAMLKWRICFSCDGGCHCFVQMTSFPNLIRSTTMSSRKNTISQLLLSCGACLMCTVRARDRREYRPCLMRNTFAPLRVPLYTRLQKTTNTN